ncbi:nitrogenase [Brenneria izadpanahii]|uniref:Nitrogenase n=1 Tax=Brenneria izadpanahii TaxID=2722756 RepID=A0ABX7UWF8_9GAMM|nr:nitrogenase component 1 [Brenneria izadpanahii]QTF10101.1 nitrogenase [Brenneria izadpanahii]
MKIRSINLHSSTIRTRENRLGSISGYHGDLAHLSRQSRCGQVKNRERCFSQSSTCLSSCAISQLTRIMDVAVVYHTPAGCTAVAPSSVAIGEQLAVKVGKKYETVIIGSDMNEVDTIFGGLNSLREIIIKTIETYRPKALFISSSCVSGVIGEDIDGLVSDLKTELDIPVVAVHCEGFKSRIWASGFDIADHAVLQGIVKPPRAKRQVINFKNFYESQREEITELFAEFGVQTQFLYTNASVEDLSHLSESLATVCICGALGTYLGNALELLYDVPYVRTINPMGVTGYETWLREIGRVINKSAEVETYIKRESAIYMPQIAALVKELSGLRAVIGMGPGYTYEVARVLQELGIKVVWGAAWHYDYQYDNGKQPPAMDFLEKHSVNNFPISVADQQNFEVMNILKQHQPDLYFSRHPGSTVWAVKQGIAAVYVADEYMIFGYKGMLSFAKTILDTVRNRSFEKNLAAHTTMPYTDWWYQQPDDALLLENE